jgi:hypothetical protein
MYSRGVGVWRQTKENFAMFNNHNGFEGSADWTREGSAGTLALLETQ